MGVLLVLHIYCVLGSLCLGRNDLVAQNWLWIFATLRHFFWEGVPTIAGDGGVDSKTMFFYVYNLHSLYALLMGKGPTPTTSRSNTGLHVACIEIVCVEISLSIKVAYIFHFILFFFVFCSRLELLIVRELLKLSKVRMEKI